MEKYPFLTLQEVEALGYKVRNEMIEKIDVNLIGHFGNIVTLEMMTNHGFLFNSYNLTRHIGIVLQCLYAVLDLESEDGKRLSEIENIPCRVVTDGNGQKIGIGHFIEDKFILECDLFNLPGVEKKK